MKWFQRKLMKPCPDLEPSGDISRAKMVRELCSAEGELVRRTNDFPQRGSNEQRQIALSRYRAAKERALLLAFCMDDDLMHDAALREILTLCVIAEDISAANNIFGKFRSKLIVDMVITEHPILVAASRLAATATDAGTMELRPLVRLLCNNKARVTNASRASQLTQFRFRNS